MPRRRRGLPLATMSPCSRVRNRNTASRRASSRASSGSDSPRAVVATWKPAISTRPDRYAARLSALPWNSSAMACAIRHRSLSCASAMSWLAATLSRGAGRAVWATRAPMRSIAGPRAASSDAAEAFASSQRRANGVSVAPRPRASVASGVPSESSVASSSPHAVRYGTETLRAACASEPCSPMASSRRSSRGSTTLGPSRPPSNCHAMAGTRRLIRQVFAYMGAPLQRLAS